MSYSTGNYSYLIRKIDEFIRKYYLNKVVRGSIYLAATLFASYIIVTLAEYYGNFNILIRSILFFAFLLLNISITLRLIILPLLSYFRLGKTISHEQASEIIGEHFSHIQDKLLNTLQLKKLADENPGQKALIEAGINQKIADLSPVPFTSAIKITENRKYLRFAIPPLAVILLIAFTAPSILSEGTDRIIHYNKKYVKKAPFRFVILNKDLEAAQGEDLELKVKMEGNEIPQDIYLEDGINSFKLDKENIIRFNYTFRNIQHNKTFRLYGGGFYSDPFSIEVKKKPSLLHFNVRLVYPSYLHKKSEIVNDAGDLTVPQGTRIEWIFTTGNTSSLLFRVNNQSSVIPPSGKDTFRHALIAGQSAEIMIKPLSNEVKTDDFISYKLTVVPDLHPSIEVSEQKDSIHQKSLYFLGKATDDHGFSKLLFNYRISGNNTKTFRTHPIAVKRDAIENNFFYSWNLNSIGIKPGQQVEYFFEIFDNDGVKGPKSARSGLRTLRLDTEKETENKIEESANKIKDKMESAIRQARSIEKDTRQMGRDLLNKKSLSFEEKKQIEELLDKQKGLEKLVDEIKKENKESLYKQNELRAQKEDILEKQKQIEDLFNNVLDEKTKELLKNIQQLLEQNNKSQTQQELSKMQLDNKSIQKELGRILELYKQLEFDQKLSGVVEKLSGLSEKQQSLGEQAQKKSANTEDLRKQQEQLNNEFADFKKDMDELDKKNNELEQKNGFDRSESEQQQIDQSQSQSSRNLRNKSTEKASENMKKAASQMRQLARKLEESQNENEAEESKINLLNLRQILANLLRASFDQEKILLDTRNTASNDPVYKALIQKQKGLLDNMEMVQDSLYSLSRKVPQIETFVNKEIETINTNIVRSLDNLSARSIAEATRDQQYALTSINNLALMLSEVEAKLQKAMKNAGQGGKGKQKSLSQLSKMQEQLNRNMQQAREQLQRQGIKEGQTPGKGEMSEQMARMAREQQLIRQALLEINRELNKDGAGKLGNLDKLSKEMEQTETDLVNKKIRQETLVRQQEILTKLLTAEKAERERETDNERESREGRDQSPVYNSMLENFKKAKQRETELLKTVPASLSLFYQLKVGDYFRNLDSK